MVVPDGDLLETPRETLGFGAKHIYTAGPQVAPVVADWTSDDVGQLQAAAARDGQRHEDGHSQTKQRQVGCL